VFCKLFTAISNSNNVYYNCRRSADVYSIFRANDARLLLKTIAPVVVGVHDSVSVLFNLYNGQSPYCSCLYTSVPYAHKYMSKVGK